MSNEGQSLNNALSSLQGCSGCCDELRAEISAIKNQLVGKIDKTEREPIVEDSINAANARYGLALVPVALPALSSLIPYIAGLISLLASFLGVQNLINGLQSLLGSQQNELERILGRLRFVEEKNSEQDELIHYLRDYAIPMLKADIIVLNRGLEQANREITKANLEINRLNGEIVKTNGAINAANAEIKRVSGVAHQAVADANRAIAETQTINQKLETEYKPVIQLAISKADFAIQTINNLGNDLISELQSQSSRISQLESENNRLQQGINDIRLTTDEAIRRANTAADIANTAAARATETQQQTNNLDRDARNGNIFRSWSPTVLQPKVTEWARLATYNPEIVQPLSIEEASRRFDIQRQQVQNDIRNAIVVSSPLAISSNQALDRTIADLRGQVTTLQNTKADRATVVTNQPALQTEITNLNNRITQQERMNERGLTEIGLMAGAIAALPNTFAQNPTYRAAMTDVAAAGTCRTTQPGGCMANQFQNLQNDLLSKIGLGLQTGQGAILTAINNTVNRIDLKMGAQMVNGLSGGMTRLSSFLGIDRLFNLLNFLATLHNASMLSASLKVTLLETLSSVGNATGLLQTSEGNNVDLNQVFNQGIETFITSLIGVDAYASMKLTWRKYSSIYRAANNVLSNVGNMFSSIGNGIEVVGENTGKIGNALRAAGVVREKAYNFMSEKMNVHTNKYMTFQTTVGGVTQVLEAINEVAESTIEGQEAYTEAVKATADFQKQLANAEKNPGIDNKALKEEAAKIKENLVKDPTGEDDEGLLSFLTDR